eukprot:TRINITY_DN3482_c0_g3_i2.p5 TRINITY_DN3482_c0_g3~~TRINITY_DN3482_c0_g3_i2.p5  ORF type:complete len:203 (+),score=0.90 TRINITY_DN3482_c0_g3_i2:1815-2423(+)
MYTKIGIILHSRLPIIIQTLKNIADNRHKMSPIKLSFYLSFDPASISTPPSSPIPLPIISAQEMGSFNTHVPIANITGGVQVPSKNARARDVSRMPATHVHRNIANVAPVQTNYNSILKNCVFQELSIFIHWYTKKGIRTRALSCAFQEARAAGGASERYLQIIVVVARASPTLTSNKQAHKGDHIAAYPFVNSSTLACVYS